MKVSYIYYRIFFYTESPAFEMLEEKEMCTITLDVGHLHQICVVLLLW